LRNAGVLQGLATISAEVVALAEKAKQGKLQPHEFQVRTVKICGQSHTYAVYVAIFQVTLG